MGFVYKIQKNKLLDKFYLESQIHFVLEYLLTL